MNAHLFITAEHFERCLEVGLFGVSVQQVNYLGNVKKGDTAFLLETNTSRLAGPLLIGSEIFYDTTNVWGDKDNYFYRVVLQPHARGTYLGDVSCLWETLLKRGPGRLFSINTFQRSHSSLFPEDVPTLITALSSHETVNPKLSIPEGINTLSDVDLILKDSSKFSSEARFEACLLVNRNLLVDMLRECGVVSTDSPIILNQVSVPITNQNIDILVITSSEYAILELKKDDITLDTYRQAKIYSRWLRCMGAKEVKIVLVGSSEGDILLQSQDQTWTYKIERNQREVQMFCNALKIEKRFKGVLRHVD